MTADKFINRIAWWLRRLARGKRRKKTIDQFCRKGHIPWTHGYNDYKWETIEKIICKQQFSSIIGSPQFGYRVDERVVELPWLFERLPQGRFKLLDAGSALNYLPLVSHPRLVDKKLYISTLEPEDSAYWNRGISYVFEDLRETCFRDSFFDVVVCISTLEHVGMDNTLLYTQDESKREDNPESYLSLINVFRTLLKEKGHVFITVPFGRQMNHGWFQVFNADMLDGIISQFEPSSYTETIFIYCNDRWKISDRDEAKDAVCYDINADNRQYAPDYCAFSRAVACLEMRK